MFSAFRRQTRFRARRRGRRAGRVGFVDGRKTPVDECDQDVTLGSFQWPFFLVFASSDDGAISV
jgi:hypothetical protein